MNVNRKFGKIDEGGKLVYAPKVLIRKCGTIIRPAEKDYMEDGWLKVVDEPLCRKDGFQVVAAGWEKCSMELKRQYEYRELPKTEVQTRVQKRPNFVQRALKVVVMKMLGI